MAQMLFIERIMKSQNCKEYKNFNHETSEMQTANKNVQQWVEIESGERICNEDFATANKYRYLFSHRKTTCQFGDAYSLLYVYMYLYRHFGGLYWESINKLNLLLYAFCCRMLVELGDEIIFVYGDIEMANLTRILLGWSKAEEEKLS